MCKIRGKPPARVDLLEQAKAGWAAVDPDVAGAYITDAHGDHWSFDPKEADLVDHIVKHLSQLVEDDRPGAARLLRELLDCLEPAAARRKRGRPKVTWSRIYLRNWYRRRLKSNQALRPRVLRLQAPQTSVVNALALRRVVFQVGHGRTLKE
jgi:hypothetical protein